jgi:hypothetical protein
MAAEKNFKTILLLPFYIDATREELIRKVGALAKEAEKLRRDYGDRIILMPGNELSCTSRGILPGDTYVDRCYAIAEHQNDEDVKKRLQQLLNDLISVSRDGFSGQLCYGAGSWEWWLPWDELDLDILGDQHYWYKDYGNPEDPDNVWFEHVKHYKRYGKRYFLAEYECSPYVGSFDFGGGDWQRSGNKDEEAQAQYIDKYHKMFNKADDLGLHIDGSFYLNYWGKPDANDSCLVEPAGLVEHRRRAFYMFASWEKQKSGDALEQRPLSHSDYLCEGTNGLGM